MSNTLPGISEIQIIFQILI